MKKRARFRAPAGHPVVFDATQEGVRDAQATVFQRTVYYDNTDQEIIQITSEKLRGILRDFEQTVGLRDAWHAPCAMWLSLLFILPTTEFHDFGLAAPTWTAIYWIAATAVTAWFFLAVRQRRRVGREANIERLVARIKGEDTDDWPW